MPPLRVFQRSHRAQADELQTSRRMTQEEITKAFEGRWRVKGDTPTGWVKGVKELCRDFFEAGVAVGGAAMTSPTTEEEDMQVRTQDFDCWWELYDKKRSREKCQKKFLSMPKKEQRACIAATPAYVRSTPDKQYRKDPLTYLNQKSWNDEIINHNTSAQQRLDKLAGILLD